MRKRGERIVEGGSCAATIIGSPGVAHAILGEVLLMLIVTSKHYRRVAYSQRVVLHDLRLTET